MHAWCRLTFSIPVIYSRINWYTLSATPKFIALMWTNWKLFLYFNSFSFTSNTDAVLPIPGTPDKSNDITKKYIELIAIHLSLFLIW